MLLEDKTAVIYGGGGAIGGAVARTFAREGAKIFLAGRTKARLEKVAADIQSRRRRGRVRSARRAGLGGSGVRVICMRPDAIPDAIPVSYSKALFDDMTHRLGTTTSEWLDAHGRQDTLLGRLPTLAQVADYAAFVASDRGGAVTGTTANLTCGSVID